MGEHRGRDDGGSRTTPNPVPVESIQDAMTTELEDIQARHQEVRHRSVQLAVNIDKLEKRQACVQAALEESRRIAVEITKGAEQRVYKVMSSAHDRIGPQQAEIARLELEIEALKRELSASQPAKPSPAAPGSRPGAGADLHDTFTSTAVSSPEEMVDQSLPEDRSWTAGYPPAAAAGQLQTDLKAQLQREHDQREEPGGRAGPTEPEPEEADTYTPPMSVLTSQQDWQALYGGLSPQSGRVHVETRGETSLMHLDAFLDTRHYHYIDPWNKQVHRHRWQIKVQVEAPDDRREEVGYSSVLAAVTSALLRYDQVLLNEVFPFDQLEPSHENIAGYFFNYLEDTVAMKGLRLVEVGLWENQILVLQVHCRNEDIDALLRGEGDLQKVRDSLFPEDSGNSETAFRKMLGMMFKNREGK